MTYEDLLANIRAFPAIADDTRLVTPGALFVAGGGREKAARYAREALERGAALIAGPSSLLEGTDISYVATGEDGCHFAQLAEAFFGSPSRELILIGVTGTCGKTTTTYLVESILHEGGFEVGVIGTENYRYCGLKLPSTNTTPGAIALNAMLHRMKDAGCDAVVMEVSSHALKQERVHGLVFDGAIFTNLSVEHQDLHPDMEDYFTTKARLFTEYSQVAARNGKIFHGCVNVGDPYGQRLANEIRPLARETYRLREVQVSTAFGGGSDADVRLSCDGTQGTISGVDFTSSLIGAFNAENIAVAIGLAQSLGLPEDAIRRGIANVSGVPGRMERVPTKQRTIFVDFAHKPGAVDAVLRVVRPLTASQVWLVFGCGGRRDRAKRPEMAKVATALADRVIITADNSRGEAWDDILHDILQGVPESVRHKVEVIPDRRQAIARAIRNSTASDTIVIAGRGSETLLSVPDPTGAERWISFSDSAVAAGLAMQFASSPGISEEAIA